MFQTLILRILRRAVMPSSGRSVNYMDPEGIELSDKFSIKMEAENITD